jgi:SAM-dependent methyltransferase
MTAPRGRRRGSPPEHRSLWAAMYAETPYEQLPWYHPDPSAHVVRAVDEGFLEPGTRVLDIGCGAGSNVLYLSRSGFHGVGVDISPGAVRAATARARGEGVRAEFRVGDALELDFPDGEFGGAVDNGCFHTLPIERRSDYAIEVSRVLAPGGRFVLSWVAREHTGSPGPPHRPSLEEVTRAFEAKFLFTRTGFHASRPDGGAAVYDAWLTSRTSPQPPPR